MVSVLLALGSRTIRLHSRASRAGVQGQVPHWPLVRHCLQSKDPSCYLLQLRAILCIAQDRLFLRFAFYLGEGCLLDGHSQEESPSTISNENFRSILFLLRK